MALPQARHGRPRLLRVPLHPDPSQHRKAQGLRPEIQPKRAKQQERSVESIALERRVKREEESGEGEAGTTRALPNGLMTIATAPPVGGCRDEGGTVDQRVGFEEGCLLARRSLYLCCYRLEVLVWIVVVVGHVIDTEVMLAKAKLLQLLCWN
ncbi:hypothetical protein ZIOFF_015075 [Zingiber officinale]|uniref:Uncharacterized protein n=1 Tax=Zingiber officinale TaxID=94328 RepID=A0A8J5HXX7_ZINOF|nr:hypothetical protein ZIOFF_015075 [Zingiber officinale]